MFSRTIPNHKISHSMTNLTLAQLQAKYAELEATFKRERSALEKQMADVKRTEQADALAKIRSIMNEFGIAPADLDVGKKSRKSPKQSGSVAVKYRGPNGETWTGRGRQPKWLGEDREKFLIKD
jgi:DNA-binding protein H-NS